MTQMFGTKLPNQGHLRLSERGQLVSTLYNRPGEGKLLAAYSNRAPVLCSCSN